MIPFADIGDVLGSPAWTAAATVLAAVAIGVTIWLYRRQRTRKSLSYEIKVTELVNIHSAAKGRIKVLFADEEIGQLHLVEARIENNGNVPVERENFERPISFDLGEGASPLTVDATDFKPDDLQPALNYNSHEIQLLPMLLNPGDSLTLQSFVSNLTAPVKCHYRIVGVSKMTDARAQRETQRTLVKKAFSFSEPFLGVGIAGITVVALIFSLFAWLFESEKKTETQVTMAKGSELCGSVLRTSDTQLILQEADTGKLKQLPLGQVESVKDDAC